MLNKEESSKVWNTKKKLKHQVRVSNPDVFVLTQEVAWYDQPSNQVGSLTSRLAQETAKVKMV